VFDVPLSAITGVVINTGAGSDTVNVESTESGAPVTIDLGSGADILNISPSAHNLDALHGNVTVAGGPGTGFDTLNVNDQSNTGDRVFGLDAGSLSHSGPAPTGQILYSGIDHTFIDGGSGSNVYTVKGTSPFLTTLNTNSGTVKPDTVNVLGTTGSLEIVNNGGGGADQVNIGGNAKKLQNIKGAVSVRNAPSRTHLLVDGSADGIDHPNVILGAGSIAGLLPGGAVITFVTNDVNSVDVKSGSGIDTFTVLSTPDDNGVNAITTLNPGGGANFITVKATGSHGPLKIVDGPFDVVTIGDAGSVQNLKSDVTLEGATTLTGLTVDDSQDTQGRAVTLAIDKVTGKGKITGLAQQAAIIFDQGGLSNLTVLGGLGSDTFTVTDTPSNGLTTLSTGAGTGVDTVNVQGTTGPLTVNGSVNAVSTVTVGNAGSLKGLNGTVLVQNHPDFNNVVVDGSADPAPLNATLALSSDGTTGRIIGLSVGEIDYDTGGTSAVEVKTGSAPAGVTGLITVTDTLHFHPTTLDVGGGEYTVKVLATTGPLTVNAGSGRDRVILGSAARTLDSIQGAVTVNGQGLFLSETTPAPATAMILEDAGAPPNQRYHFSGNTTTRVGAAPMTVNNGALGVDYSPSPIFFAGVAGASPAGHVFDVEGIAPGVSLTLHGDNARATVNLGNAAGSLDDLHGSLTITGQGGSADINVHDEGAKTAQVYTLGAGTLARSGAGLITSDLPGSLVVNGGSGGNRFDVESLTAGHPTTLNAGAGGDLVRMRGGPIGSALTLNGTGNTRLGYAAYSRAVYANLGTGVATDVAAFRGVHSLTGGRGNNILVGGDGDDELIAGPGRSLLIGGGGHDHLLGNGAEDVLIGGRTAYDGDRAALEAVMAEWGRTDLGYQERVDRLLHGSGGVPALNASTVFDDGAADVLEGGKGRDLFFASLGDLLPDRHKNEVLVAIN
jgi:hypothetical protein